MSRVSIVIPAHDGAALTQRCIDTLIDQDLGAEIVVVDDASRDETSLLLESYGDKVTVLRNQENEGFARATNRGVAASTGELVVLLNNDTEPRAGWLAAMVDYADHNPDVGIVGAKLLYPDGRIQHAGVAFGPTGYPYHLYCGFPGDHPATNRSRRFQVVTAACMLIRRSVFDELDGFDEGFVNSAEDVDLCLRAGRLGHEVHYCADAVLMHMESATRGREIQRQSETLYRQRWADTVRHDELEYLLADDLLTITHGPSSRLTVGIDPIIGAVEGADPLAAERAVDDVTRLWVDAVVERDALLREHRRRSVVPIGFDSVGVPTATHFPLKDSAPIDRTLARADFLKRKTGPLSLRVTRHSPTRLNVLFEGFSAASSYGGHATIMQLAAAFVASGRRVRIIGTDTHAAHADASGARVLAEAALEIDGADALIDAEYVDVSSRDSPIEVSPHDRFVATSWWTMHAADAAARQLRVAPPLWVVQEYEPFFYPAGSFAAAARAAYDMPHSELISTSLLADYLSAHSIGAAAHGWRRVVFDNSLTTIDPPDALSLDRPTPPRILAYLRDAPRNLTETALAGLEIADRRGDIPSDWSITGIGGDLTGTSRVGLEGGRSIELFDRLSPGRYRAMLRSHDVGIALQDTPHPGLTSLDMAAAGQSVVTTTFDGKPASALSGISSNILAVAPTPDAIADAITLQIARRTDFAARADGARFEWPRSASETFTADLVTSALALIDG